MDETEERMNKQLAEAAKRENVLVLRLSAREQELQDVAAVAVKYRQQQVPIILYHRSYANNSSIIHLYFRFPQSHNFLGICNAYYVDHNSGTR